MTNPFDAAWVAHLDSRLQQVVVEGGGPAVFLHFVVDGTSSHWLALGPSGLSASVDRPLDDGRPVVTFTVTADIARAIQAGSLPAQTAILDGRLGCHGPVVELTGWRSVLGQLSPSPIDQPGA